MIELQPYFQPGGTSATPSSGYNPRHSASGMPCPRHRAFPPLCVARSTASKASATLWAWSIRYSLRAASRSALSIAPKGPVKSRLRDLGDARRTRPFTTIFMGKYTAIMSRKPMEWAKAFLVWSWQSIASILGILVGVVI